jgi:hypothetical protein
MQEGLEGNFQCAFFPGLLIILKILGVSAPGMVSCRICMVEYYHEKMPLKYAVIALRLYFPTQYYAVELLSFECLFIRRLVI